MEDHAHEETCCQCILNGWTKEKSSCGSPDNDQLKCKHYLNDRIILGRKGWEKVVDLVKNPPPPNDHLQRLLREHVERLLREHVEDDPSDP